MVEVLLYVFVAVAILFPFVIVPEILQRWGYDTKSRFVRVVVWSVFVTFLIVPAALSGALWANLSPADWVVLALVVTFAALWEYHRLHPDTFP